MKKLTTCLLTLFILTLPASGWAWHDETHIAIAKVAGYYKWFNATGADMAKIKAGNVESKNHFVNNPPSTIVTPEMVLEQASLYNNPDDEKGHLYGAIIGSLREYRATTKKGKYAEYHLGYAAHYLGDLSQPLHNMLYNSYNRRYHAMTDGIINDEVLDKLDRINIYPIEIKSEEDLAREVARIANQAMNLGYQLEKEGRLLNKHEAYLQISHSASLFKAVLVWLGKMQITSHKEMKLNKTISKDILTYSILNSIADAEDSADEEVLSMLWSIQDTILIKIFHDLIRSEKLK